MLFVHSDPLKVGDAISGSVVAGECIGVIAAFLTVPIHAFLSCGVTCDGLGQALQIGCVNDVHLVKLFGNKA